MPTFCRHNRFEESCPICSRKPATKPGTVSGAAAARRPARERPSGKRRTPRATDLVVRRVARAEDDGYENDLAPGLRASEDARRLADEIAWAVARLEQLSSDPPGLLAEAAAGSDREEALWLTFLVAYIGPQEGVGDPFGAIAAARTSWASGELPALEDVTPGPRAAHTMGSGTATLVAYRARAEKAGGQHALLSAEPALTPSRRFERAFERLSLPRLQRAPRYEFLVMAGWLGLLDARPVSLLFGVEATDPATMAAKRVFGIGDAINLGRRAGELIAAFDVPPAALDLGLVNWGRTTDDRITAGADVAADPAVTARLVAALGLRAEAADESPDDD